jgi:hypothetical protein
MVLSEVLEKEMPRFEDVEFEKAVDLDLQFAGRKKEYRTDTRGMVGPVGTEDVS